MSGPHLPRSVPLKNGDVGLDPDHVLDELLMALADELDIVVVDRSTGDQTASATLWVQRAERHRTPHGRLRRDTRANVARSHLGTTRSAEPGTPRTRPAPDELED